MRRITSIELQKNLNVMVRNDQIVLKQVKVYQNYTHVANYFLQANLHATSFYRKIIRSWKRINTVLMQDLVEYDFLLFLHANMSITRRGWNSFAYFKFEELMSKFDQMFFFDDIIGIISCKTRRHGWSLRMWSVNLRKNLN